MVQLVGLTMPPAELPQFDTVLMNPPFEKYSAPNHIKRAFDRVRPGGCLVSVFPGNIGARQYDDFREWLGDHARTIQQLPAGSFNGPDAFIRTGVSACLIWIEKPGNTEDFKKQATLFYAKLISSLTGGAVIVYLSDGQPPDHRERPKATLTHAGTY